MAGAEKGRRARRCSHCGKEGFFQESSALTSALMYISVFDVDLSFPRHGIQKMDTYRVQFRTESCPLIQDVVESLKTSSA